MGPQAVPTKAISIFFSYAHEDELLRKGLEKQLTLLKRQGLISDWNDRDIKAGQEWAHEIDKNLNSAQIILLLISSSFLASDYCYSIEMKRALEKHEAKEAVVIPVILRPVDWENAPFSKLQALPTDGKPVTTWRNRDEAFSNIVRGIRNTVKELLIKQLLDEGHTFYMLRQYGTALKAYEQVIQLDPDDIHVHDIIVTLRNFQKYEESLVFHEQTIRLDPSDAFAYINAGHALMSLERFDEALVDYEQAIRLDPNDAITYDAKSYALLKLGHYDESLAACEQAIHLNLNYSSAYSSKGAALGSLQRYNESVEACEQAIRLDPNNATAYANKGSSLTNLKRFAEALTAYEQAIRLNPNDASAYIDKSAVLAKLKRYKESQEAYEKALQLGYTN